MMIVDVFSEARSAIEMASGANADIAALRERVADLEAALQECADDLECEVRATHGADHPDGIHPSQVWKYERDMEPVSVARALLETKP